ncbi:hypothetical protein HMPREF0971_00937, partial [Segatella oris F0302]
EFFITEITHTVGEDSYYSNTFRAIPAVVDTLPEPEVEMPIAEPQMARVTRNDDKFGHGRVQVQMNWQTEKMSTDWLRVMAPDGGSSDQVKSNRGFVFIPEVGDHVLVGFRHGDPNRPYVMGSLFNGTTGAGGSKGNKIKSITTRSGCSLLLNDAKGSVTLHDKGGVNMDFDGGGHYLLEAGSKTTTSVGKGEKSILTMDSEGVIDLSGEKKISIKVGDNILEINSEDNSISLTAKVIKITASQSITIGNGQKKADTLSGIAITQAGNVDIVGNPVNINNGKGGLVNIK